MARVKSINVKKIVQEEEKKLRKMGLKVNDDTLELENAKGFDEDEREEDEDSEEDEDENVEVESRVDDDDIEIPDPPAQMIDFDEYLKWQKKLKPQHWNRLIIYVNRKHPAIDRTLSNPKNKKYIDKLVEPIDENYFETMHGGGSYEMYVNVQRRGGSTTLCRVRVKVPMEIDPVIDLDELIVEHHLNRSYVNKLKRQGKLDNNLNVVKPKVEGEQEMETMKDMQGQFIDLIKTMRDDERQMLMSRLRENNDGKSQAMLQMMMEASKASIEMVKENSRGSQQDPRMMLEMVKMMKDIVGEQRGNGSNDDMAMMFQWMMKQSELQNAMLLKLMETKAEPAGGFLDQMEKMISVARMINGGGGSEGGWVDKLIDKGSEILPNLLNVVNTAFMMKGSPGMAAQMMQQQQGVNGGQMGVQPMQNGGIDPERMNMARQLVQQYGGFLAMKLAQGKGGDEFAAELYETFSPVIFEQSIRGPIKQVGVDVFVEAVMENPQLQMQILNVLGTRENFEKWAMDFMTWDDENGNDEEGGKK